MSDDDKKKKQNYKNKKNDEKSLEYKFITVVVISVFILLFIILVFFGIDIVKNIVISLVVAIIVGIFTRLSGIFIRKDIEKMNKYINVMYIFIIIGISTIIVRYTYQVKAEGQTVTTNYSPSENNTLNGQSNSVEADLTPKIIEGETENNEESIIEKDNSAVNFLNNKGLTEMIYTEEIFNHFLLVLDEEDGNFDEVVQRICIEEDYFNDISGKILEIVIKDINRNKWIAFTEVRTEFPKDKNFENNIGEYESLTAKANYMYDNNEYITNFKSDIYQSNQSNTPYKFNIDDMEKYKNSTLEADLLEIIELREKALELSSIYKQQSLIMLLANDKELLGQYYFIMKDYNNANQYLAKSIEDNYEAIKLLTLNEAGNFNNPNTFADYSQKIGRIFYLLSRTYNKNELGDFDYISRSLLMSMFAYKVSGDFCADTTNEAYFYAYYYGAMSAHKLAIKLSLSNFPKLKQNLFITAIASYNRADENEVFNDDDEYIENGREYAKNGLIKIINSQSPNK